MNIANALGRGAQATLVLSFLAFPVSLALANVSLLLTLLLWLSSLAGAGPRAQFGQALRNPLVAPAIALFAWIVLASAWSPASAPEILGFLQKYLKFLFVPMFIALLQDARTRRRCWQAFALALIFTLVVTWLNVWFDFSWTRTHNQGFGQDHTVVKDYISQGIMMGVFALICAFTAIRSRTRAGATLAWIAWALASASIMVLLLGRTGHLAWMASSAAFALTAAAARSRAAVAASAGGIALLVGVVLLISPVMHERINVALQQAQMSADAPVSSVGARVAMIRFTAEAALEHPVFGHGTAAYPVLAKAHFTDPSWCSVVCPHPHNQFLFFLVEQGLIGLALFLWFVAATVREAWRHDPARRAFVLGFVAILVTASGTHSALWLSTESHCLILMSALIMAGLHARRHQAPAP